MIEREDGELTALRWRPRVSETAPEWAAFEAETNTAV